MDILKTVEPRSDQLNFDDVATRVLTVTITEVKVVGGEQPVELHLAEYPGRPFKPGKSMRRVLIQAWGTKASEWAGRQLRLYGDPEVKFGGQKVGGIRISHLSHIDAPVEVSLTVTRGKRAPFIVQPLTTRDWLAELALAEDDLDAVKALGVAARKAGASADVLEVLRNRYKELEAVRGE